MGSEVAVIEVIKESDIMEAVELLKKSNLNVCIAKEMVDEIEATLSPYKKEEEE